ncbi:MAG: hypothetical protein ACYDH5_04685 [Acidimicrobiales bacterium]
MVVPEQLRHDDTPSALAILADLLDHRDPPPAGWEPTSEGAWVDWDALGSSQLSSSEVAALNIARGCALAERHGGLPFAVAAPIHEAIEELTGGWTAGPGQLLAPGGDAYPFARAVGPFADAVGLAPCDPAGPDPGDRTGAEHCAGPRRPHLPGSNRGAALAGWREPGGTPGGRAREECDRRGPEPVEAPGDAWGVEL